jgi:hypothetical protein
VSRPTDTSAFGTRCIPSCGVARRLNIGQWICALLAPCRMGASVPSLRQPISGTEHWNSFSRNVLPERRNPCLS